MFINNVIQILTMNFLFQHTNSTTYYSQANGQVEYVNKVIGALMTKFKNKKMK